MKLKRKFKYYFIRLFRQKASPHQVAKGLMIGFIANWYPTFGFGPIISAGIARAARANVIAAVVGGVISTPLWPILFIFNYQMGSLFVHKPVEATEIEDVRNTEAVNDTVSSLQLGSMQFLTGALANTVLSSVITYIISYFLFKKYRMNILEKLKQI